MATPCFDEPCEVSTITELHHKIVVLCCLRSRDERDHVCVLDFCHDLNFIYQKAVCLLCCSLALPLAEAFPVHDLDSVSFSRVSFQVSEFHFSELTFSKCFVCQNNLYAGVREYYNFQVLRVQLVLIGHN